MPRMCRVPYQGTITTAGGDTDLVTNPSTGLTTAAFTVVIGMPRK